MTKKSSPELSLASRLNEHVLITDHLQNLARAHGDVDASPTCSCGAALGRVTPGLECFCGHMREEHRGSALGGCQKVVVQVRTVAEFDQVGTPTGRTRDVVERVACECSEFRSKPSTVPSRANIIDTWLKHAGLPQNPTRDHLLLRVVGSYAPDVASPTIAHCLCGDHLINESADPTDPAGAITLWAAHVELAAEKP